MGIAGGENLIRVREARILLDCEEQLRHGLIEAPAQEMGLAYYIERRADAGAGAEAQRGLDMLDRDVGLARPSPEDAADKPASSVVRVEREGSVNQRHHGADILAEIGQRLGGIGQDARVVADHFQGSPREIGALQTVRRPVFAPAVMKQPITAIRGPGECGSVTRIALDRLLEQTERFGHLPCRREDHRMGTQIKVVAVRSFVGRPAERAVSAACNADSMTPATLEATLSWRSKTSPSEPSKRSAQRCVPATASINCPVIRTRWPALRTEPSST